MLLVHVLGGPTSNGDHDEDTCPIMDRSHVHGPTQTWSMFIAFLHFLLFLYQTQKLHSSKYMKAHIL